MKKMTITVLLGLVATILVRVFLVFPVLSKKAYVDAVRSIDAVVEWKTNGEMPDRLVVMRSLETSLMSSHDTWIMTMLLTDLLLVSILASTLYFVMKGKARVDQ